MKFCVIEVWTDGTTHVWGPFSEHRAEMAAEALREADHGIALEHVSTGVLYSSARMDREYPDWKRGALV